MERHLVMPGFLPTRQLVLVDLLSLMVATRPGERAVVAVDGPAGVGKTALVGEILALAPMVAGRTVLTVPVAGVDDEALRARRMWPDEAGDDALLLVEGAFLRRPELTGAWDATCLVTAPARLTGPVDEVQRSYQRRARLWQPTWIVDNSDLQRPELIVPDPEEPQWFGEDA